jgi:hypothetical protein
MSKRRFVVDFALLKAYKSKFGNLEIPLKYVVPKNDQWAASLQGKRIGKHAQTIKTKLALKSASLNTRELIELTQIGFSSISQKQYGENILQALSLYKQKFGNCHVEYDFKVPLNDGLWPEKLWDMNLGAVLCSIRQNKSYASIHHQLTELGYDWSVSRHVKRINFTLFHTFQRVYNHLRIPGDFTVPETSEWPAIYWRFDLGRYGREIQTDMARKLGRFDKTDVAALSKMSFLVDMDADREDRILTACQTWNSKFRTAHIPLDFIVPEGDQSWSDATWGLHLGAVWRSIVDGEAHERIRAQVVSYGFEDQANFSGRRTMNRPYEQLYSALVAFKSIFGHVNVPWQFVVPSGDSTYPFNTWGMTLGRHVSRIRRGHLHAKHRDDLLAIGFSYESVKSMRARTRGGRKLSTERGQTEQAASDAGAVQATERQDFSPQAKMEALRSFKANQGHVNIPANFTVPDSELWPQESHGLNLSSVQQDIRSQRESSFKHLYRQELVELGFSLESDAQKRFNVFYSALQTFKTLNNHVDVPWSFVIPTVMPQFPVDTWGLKLGSRLKSICKRGDLPQFHSQLMSLGVKIALPTHDFDTVCVALKAYKAVHGDLLVSRSFEIPVGDDSYPQSVWAMKLGELICLFVTRIDSFC